MRFQARASSIARQPNLAEPISIHTIDLLVWEELQLTLGPGPSRLASQARDVHGVWWPRRRPSILTPELDIRT